MIDADIDIDVADRVVALDGLRHVAAVELHGSERRRHVCGVYFQAVPVDPLDDMAVWDYETAEDFGFTKIDLIHNTIYDDIHDEAHLIDLLVTEPPWELFDDPEIVGQLHHVRGNFDAVQAIRPHSIMDLAICIALIRPGKRHLIGQPRDAIDQEIWRPTTKYFYKKAHAVSYAASVVVQLNRLIERAWQPGRGT